MSVFVRRLSRHIPIVEAFHGFLVFAPPAGFAFLTDDVGNLLVDDQGVYLVAPA